MATFATGIGFGRANKLFISIINESCSPVKTQVFDLWYYSLRMVRDPRLATMKILSQFKPEKCQSWQEAYAVAQCGALFSKRADLELGVDREQAAIQSFHKSEVVCYEMNRKLRSPLDPDYRDRATLIFKMSRKISEVLGSCPHPFDLDYGFGPGVNVGCKKYTTVTEKLSVNATSTRAAASLLRDAMLTPDVHWPGLRRLTLVNSSEFAVVPKSWKTDRGIMIEPIVNTFLQKGIGCYIRERLRENGINLNDQTRNQRLALLGSKSGAYATIDLSMASDTIASLLVLDLLPHEWFDLLDRCRCAFTRMPDGQLRELEKFSSMGNGYTFELESLIFFALCSVVCPGEVVSVYGDDLIVPTHRYSDVISALRLLGFIPNDDKSFGVGPFRESCGADFFEGINVRPIFFKDFPQFRDLFRFYNWAQSSGFLSQSAARVITMIPLVLRQWGPPGFGDGHLVDANYPLTFDKKVQDLRYRFKTFVAKPVRTKADYADYFAFIYFRTFKDLGDMDFDSVGRNIRTRSPIYKSKTLITCPFGQGSTVWDGWTL